jgi:hypothetical protein
MSTHTIRREILCDGEVLIPGFDDIDYNNSYSGQPMCIEIAAEATNQAVDLSGLGTIKHLEIDIPAASVGYLTMKVGTSTQALPIGQKTILSEDVSTLYFTSTSEAGLKIFIIPFYA